MTEGALANRYRGAKMAASGEVVNRPGDAASRRLSSDPIGRPSVASGQPNYRYRGYYKNRDFPSHKLFSCSSSAITHVPFCRKTF